MRRKQAGKQAAGARELASDEAVIRAGARYLLAMLEGAAPPLPGPRAAAGAGALALEALVSGAELQGASREEAVAAVRGSLAELAEGTI